MFAIALRALDQPVEWADATASFVTTLGVSIAIGGLAGYVASRIVARVDDHLIETSISVLLAYGTYVLADTLHESGVIATVVAGMTLGTYGPRIGMSERTQEAIDVIWEFLSFLFTALVFLLVGLAITVGSLAEAAAAIGVGIAAVLASRALVTYGLIGWGGRLLGGGMTMPAEWLHVLFWAGLRGAVAVALALSLPAGFPQRTHLQAITFGIVLFTLIAQGCTVGWAVNHFVPHDGDPGGES